MSEHYGLDGTCDGCGSEISNNPAREPSEHRKDAEEIAEQLFPINPLNPEVGRDLRNSVAEALTAFGDRRYAEGRNDATILVAQQAFSEIIWCPTHAQAFKMREALEFIWTKNGLVFAECTVAEEIMWAVKNALLEAKEALDTSRDTLK